ncbi:MAG: VCBS repeat-containing protein [Planctomycetota bacterium]
MTSRVLAAVCVGVVTTAALAAQGTLRSYPGWGLAAPAGDVNGDGIADFIGRPSTARDAAVVSGRDGALLHTVPAAVAGAPKFANRPLGDVDGDGKADLALGSDTDLLVYSPATGAVLWRQPTSARLVGSLAGVDDQDGDGRREILVLGSSGAANVMQILSGATGQVLTGATIASFGVALGLGDIDSDGFGDYAIALHFGQHTFDDRLEVFSGRTHERVRSHGAGAGWQFADGWPVDGDLDEDGADDYVFSASSTFSSQTLVVSGASGEPLRSWSTGYFGGTDPGGGPGVGDVDGDGTPDLGLGIAQPQVYSGRTFQPLQPLPGLALAGLEDTNGDGTPEVLTFGLNISHLWTPGSVDFIGLPSVGATGITHTQSMSLSAPAALAGETYLILGTLSGTTPGLSLLGQHLPLNPDAYTTFTASGVPGLLVPGGGTLSATGQATADLMVPGLPASAVGLTLHHAYAVLDSSGLAHVSAPVPFAIWN